MRRAFRRQHATLGSSVDVEEPRVPGMLDALPRFMCQGLGPANDEVGRDMQSSLLLLLCQHVQDGGIAGQHARLPLVELPHQLLYWIARRQL